MDYPVWDPGVGYGVLMALFGVVHVFLSHFAIGGGLYLVVAERRARRAQDAAALAHVRRLSAFFAPTTLVAGALTGVGIWFVVGALNPAATEALIHTFVWGWAIEWTFFLVEVLAAILYARGWDRLSPRAHEALGWVYFAAAWLSLVVINGIVTFMLTPGRWTETGSFWDGFLNPTYAPSLVLRTGICVLMAGLFGGFVASRERDGAVRARLVRGHAAWGLTGLAVAVGAFVWYRGALPAEVLAAVGERLRHPARALATFAATSAALGAGFALLLARPRAGRVAATTALLAVGFVWFGAFEWWRESARKPWAIVGVVYGNGIEAARLPEYARTGLLPAMTARTGDDGRDLFLHQCRSCHTLDGYNPVLPAFAGTDATFVAGVLAGLHEMRAKMPPFAGTDAERETLAAWLWARADRTPLSERARREGKDLGALVYEVRCATCHVVGGFNDKTAKLAEYDASDVRDLLGTDLAKEMPTFSGSEEEREALVRHLTAGRAPASPPEAAPR